MELDTLENTLFELPPIKRTVPTTITRITASITAYSARSWPCSSDQSLRSDLVMFSSSPFGTCVEHERRCSFPHIPSGRVNGCLQIAPWRLIRQWPIGGPKVHDCNRILDYWSHLSRHVIA